MKTSGYFLFLFLLIATGFAQSPSNQDNWYLNKVIREIKFEGLRNVSRTDLDSVTRTFLNKNFTDDLFRELQAILYGLDYFEGFIRPEIQKADPEGNTIVIIFHVQEKPSIFEIKFSGNTRLAESELRDKIKSKKDEIITSSKVRRDEIEIRNYYLEKGFTNVQVSSSTQRVENRNAVILTFTINEGPQTIVREIKFEGVSQVSETSLRGILKTKESGFFNSGLFQEANLVADRQGIIQFYNRQGFIDAKILEIKRVSQFDESQNRNSLSLIFVIDEGHQFTYGGTTIEGNTLYKTEELLSFDRLSVGQILNKELADNAYNKIIERYFEDGYIFNTIERLEKREERTISYIVRIIERPRARIENIIIKGNTKTQENVILREIPLETGDVFSRSKIIEGLRNLMNLQYFSAVNPETPPGSAEGLMDLIINVEEANTAEVMFGLSFSGATEFPVSLNLKWQDRNFFGRGQTFGLEFNASPVQQNFSFNFSEPWAFDRRINLSTSISFGHYLRSNIEQDVVYPFYTDSYIPDPYNNYTYVFTSTTTYNAITYQEGQVFPGTPSASDISTYNLKLQYDYDREKGILKSGQNTMSLDEYSFNLGFGLGYSLFSFLGRFIFGSSFNTSLQYITYDDTIYRPANSAIRNNLNIWQFENTLSFRTFWDTRDFIYNPEMGTLLGYNFSITGGFLGGFVHLNRLTLKGEANYRLFRIPLADWYTLRAIARVRSVMSFIYDPWGGPGKVVAQPKHLLYVDGMTAGRGWRPSTNLQNGFSSWSANFEFRLPVVENFLWFDTFFDALIFRFQNISLLPVEGQNFYFSYGFGLRIINPQLPIGVYLTKPFRLNQDGSINWEKGDGIFWDADFRITITFGFDIY